MNRRQEFIKLCSESTPEPVNTRNAKDVKITELWSSLNGSLRSTMGNRAMSENTKSKVGKEKIDDAVDKRHVEGRNSYKMEDRLSKYIFLHNYILRYINRMGS